MNIPEGASRLVSHSERKKKLVGGLIFDSNIHELLGGGGGVAVVVEISTNSASVISKSNTLIG